MLAFFPSENHFSKYDYTKGIKNYILDVERNTY